MSRWTRDQEDADRLPHGMVRTAYDADTRQYTFLDTTDGTEYVSAPGAAYGTLVPAATATFPKITRTTGRRTTVQGYDRPVIFADEIGQMRRSPQPSMGHKRNPTMPASSRHHSSSGSTRKQGRNRSASFSDILPSHLIARASDSPKVPTATATTTTTSKPRSAWARGGLAKSAPPSPPPPPYSEKKPAEWSSSPTKQLLSLPTLSSSPPPLPPKDYPASSAQQSGETRVPHAAMRLTARVLGRALGAAKSGQRSPKGQSADDGWVVV